ncbi:MAG TPA: hypothetical protein VK463_08025 [Desulfomonilaceae bacterium]|nr:hypothetical protein [Desulfomonilaceae bacterium]
MNVARLDAIRLLIISGMLLTIALISHSDAASPVMTNGDRTNIAEEAANRLRACPGCDADVLPGKCRSGFVPDSFESGTKVPLQTGTTIYPDASGIGRADRSILQSTRSLNDSIRRMNNSINRMRTIQRRF